MMKFKVQIINILCLLFTSYHAGSHENQTSKMLNINYVDECDSFAVFVANLLQAKVEYEKAAFHIDMDQLERKKKLYLSMVANFKLNKKLNINCINYELEKKESLNNKLMQFSYLPPYSSFVPKCVYINYEVCLLLLKYNLSLNADELVCQDSLF